MTSTSSESTKLIIIRGNSASGKSTIARTIRERFGNRGLAIVEQDYVRREILKESAGPGTPNIGLIDLIARYALNNGYHVIVEGILNAESNGEMLVQLASDHRGETFAFYLDIPFEDTLLRHATRSTSGEFGESDMRRWYRSTDLIPALNECVISAESTLEASVAFVQATASL